MVWGPQGPLMGIQKAKKAQNLRLGGLQKKWRKTNVKVWEDYKKTGEKLISQVRRTTKKVEKSYYLSLGGLQKKWRKTNITGWEDYKKK